ncbi:MAG: hypothetical protein N2662_09520 [Bacteroidales bacterium]|nr:hypothetical protein [Bacteroidales bacterium]
MKSLFYMLLMFFLLLSCKKEKITDEIFVAQENVVNSDKIESAVDSITIKEILEKADLVYLNFSKYAPKLKAAGIPHYIGVLPISGYCPTSFGQIRYHEDLEDNRPATKYNNGPNCFTAFGLQANGGNADWTVCIVDASIYKFDKIKYAYGIFDLSHLQFLNGAPEVFIHADDEDEAAGGNDNHYDSPSYGFERNPYSPYYPTQKPMKNTEFWMYYFKANPSSTLKLPNLGFRYAVFSNFSTCECDWTRQNTFNADTEDSNPANAAKVYMPDASNYGIGVLDPIYKIVSVGKNITYYIQDAGVWSY